MISKVSPKNPPKRSLQIRCTEVTLSIRVRVRTPNFKAQNLDFTIAIALKYNPQGQIQSAEFDHRAKCQ